MKNSSSILINIERRLHGVRNKQNRVDLLSNALIFLIGFILMVTVLIIAELLFEFSSFERTALAIIFILSFLVMSMWMVGRPFLRLIGILSSVSEDATAQHIGAFFPFIRDRLINSLQLAKNVASNSAMYSAELTDESLKDFAAEIQPLDFTQSVDSSRLPQFRRWLMISAGFSILVMCLFPASFSSASISINSFYT